jgi:general secretion pathway protein E/type IV pilus assembly protein PilB
MGIYELFAITEETQRLISEGAAAGKLRAHARVNGMKTLREDGIRKITAGLTTVEEVVSITMGDAA